jgi:hypothetical protein
VLDLETESNVDVNEGRVVTQMGQTMEQLIHQNQTEEQPINMVNESAEIQGNEYELAPDTPKT